MLKMILDLKKAQPYLLAYFENCLTVGEQSLVVLRDELYKGKWLLMRTDLLRGLETANGHNELRIKIEKDIDGVDKLKAFEDLNACNLGDFIKLK